MSEAVGHWFFTLLRQVLVAIITSAAILAALIIGFHGQTEAEVQRQEETINANLAIACVLSLPVDLETGRDEDAVMKCFTQYGLEAPKLG